MNSFQLKCFLLTAETLNFAKTAREMNTTQPTITHQIKSLEDELNVKLFNRSTRVVELTADGLAFLDDAKSMVSIEEQAKLRFSISNEQNIELITIGFTNNLQVNLLTTAFEKLNKSINNFHPRIVVNTRNHLMHLMDTNQVDVVFDLVDEVENNNKYKFVKLLDSQIIAYLKNEKPFNSIETLSPEENFEMPVIFTNPTNNVANFSKFQLLISEKLEIKNIHFAPSPETAIVLAKSGIGIAILPSIYIENDNKNMKQFELEKSPNYRFGMFYKSPADNPTIKNFVNIVKSEFIK